MRYTSFDITSFYLDSIAKLNQVDVDKLFNADIKSSIEKSIIDTANQIELYARIFDVKVKEPNIFKLLYFCAESLTKYLKEIYIQDIKKLMLLMMKSHIKLTCKIEEDETNDFFERTCKKISQVLLFGKEKEYYGSYGIYTIFISLLRFQSKSTASAESIKNKDIKTEVKSSASQKTYLMYLIENDKSKITDHEEFYLIKGWKIGELKCSKTVYLSFENRVIALCHLEVEDMGESQSVIKRCDNCSGYEKNELEQYIKEYNYNNLYVFKLRCVNKYDIKIPFEQISGNYAELTDTQIKSIKEAIDEQ